MALDTNLVAHYLLNNNSDDCIGTYDGTDTAMTYSGDVGEFNGSTGEISLPSLNSSATDDFTITFWTKIEVNSVGQPTIFSWFGDKKFDIRVRYADTTSPQIHLSYYDTAWISVTHTITLSNTTLYFVKVTYKNGVGFNISVDNADNQAFAYTGTFASGTDTNRVGEYGAISGYNFEGVISNLRIYSDLKTQIFIDELYAEGYYPKPLTAPTTDGLIVHYPLTGTAEDITGSYDGTEYSYNYIDNIEFGAVSNFSSNYYFVADIGSIPYNYTINFWTASSQDSGDASLSLGRGPNDSDQYGVMFYRMERFYGGDNTSSWAFITDQFTQYLGTQLHMYTLTKNGIDFDVYIDGTLVDTVIASDEIVYINNLLYLGRGYNSGFYASRFRDVRIYDKDLTATEITDIYNYEKNFR